MRIQSIIYILLLIIPSAYAGQPDWREHNPICQKEVEHKLKEMDIKSKWVRFIAGKAGSFSYRAPISIGVWAQVTVEKNSITVSKLTESNGVSSKYSEESCIPQIAIQSVPKDLIPKKDSLRDVELKKIVDSGENGVIYIWSPQMSLSPIGFHHIEEAAKKAGAKLHVYVDPRADVKVAAKVAKQARMPASTLKPMNSFDLVMRGATLHYPATFTYKDGKLSRWAKHGYENQVQFEEFIQNELKK